MMGTRTHVTYFSRDSVQKLMQELNTLERSLFERQPHMTGDGYSEAWDRIEAVRLAVKRLSDICPD